MSQKTTLRSPEEAEEYMQYWSGLSDYELLWDGWDIIFFIPDDSAEEDPKGSAVRDYLGKMHWGYIKYRYEPTEEGWVIE